MARLPRIYVKGCSYHIVQRGNNPDQGDGVLVFIPSRITQRI